MDADAIDYIVRSRPTICEILTNRGYDVEEYKGVSPKDLTTMIASNIKSLEIIAKKREGGEGPQAPMERAVVLYFVEGPIRLSLNNFTKILFADTETGARPLKAATDDIIVLHNEPNHDAFTAQSQVQWIANKARVSFFSLKNIISNPTKHVFVPPHRKLSAEETAMVMKRLHVESKSSFPHIKFHADMQARVLGLVPGDVVEIQRPSDTGGITTLFRICTL
jgi:DNA-directed RNA polymerase subunit H (RpoH/RPB5)